MKLIFTFIRYSNSAPIQAFQVSLSQAAKNQAPSTPLHLDPELQVASPSPALTSGADEGNYVSLGRRQNYAELAFSPANAPKPAYQPQHPAAVVMVPGSADSTLTHIPPPMATLSLSKLKSVLSSCPQNQQTSPPPSDALMEAGLPSPTGTLVAMTPATNSSSGGTINQLYDMNLSCSSNAYESIIDVSI